MLSEQRALPRNEEIWRENFSEIMQFISSIKHICHKFIVDDNEKKVDLLSNVKKNTI